MQLSGFIADPGMLPGEKAGCLRVTRRGSGHRIKKDPPHPLSATSCPACLVTPWPWTAWVGADFSICKMK